MNQAEPVWETLKQAAHKPKVYVASTLSNWKRAREAQEKLREAGILITYDWTKWGEAIYGEGTEVKPEGINPEDRLRVVANDEVNGVYTAHTVLAILPGGLGTHFEMALAWATKIPVVLLTDGDTAARPTAFHYLDGIERIGDISQAIIRTIELAQAFALVENYHRPHAGILQRHASVADF